MLTYILRRIAYMVPTLFLISIVAFMIIQLPPGSFLDSIVAQMSSSGESVDSAALEALKARYSLDQPIFAQYSTWMWNIIAHGDFGQSFQWNQPVSRLLRERLGLTIAFGIATVLFTWIVAIPIGIFSAVRQYSAGDYVFTTVGFLGLATPNFLLALVFMYIGYKYFGQSVGGLFSPAYQNAEWNLGKVLDLLSHLWIPVVVLGMAHTAGLIRVLRGQLLDELRKPYVVAARARGIPELRILFRYSVRVAINPFISTIGWTLPSLVGGEIIVAQVMSLNTTGPLLLQALTGQDMYLAGSIILIVSVLTVIGTLISDLLLAWIDPRVRLRYQ